MIQYNVTYKGYSIGLTFSKTDALSWANSKEHKIQVVKYTGVANGY